MKPRLQTSLGQHLVMTPQLRQAIRLLQLSAAELEIEIAERGGKQSAAGLGRSRAAASARRRRHRRQRATAPTTTTRPRRPTKPPWDRRRRAWYERIGPADSDDDSRVAEQVAETETLQDHLLWQLHLSHLSPRDRMIGVALIEAIDDDGYLREPLEAIAETPACPRSTRSSDEILTVLHQVQRFDPAGVGARSLGECLRLQLALLPDDTPGQGAGAARWPTARWNACRSIGVAGLAAELQARPLDEVEAAVQLLRSLDPRPGAQIGGYRQRHLRRRPTAWSGASTACGASRWPPARGRASRIHRGYERMIRHASEADAQLPARPPAGSALAAQEPGGARRHPAQGDALPAAAAVGVPRIRRQALRPLTLREVAGEVGLHESTISRAIARKYVRTPRGTIPLRAFFASGIDTGGGGEASSTAIQAMIRRLIEAENPRKPLSDARLAETLKATGVPVARRTVAKYREAMSIPRRRTALRIG